MTEVERRARALSLPEIRGLYAIADADATAALGLDLDQVAAGLLAAGPPVMQLRAKDRSCEQTVSHLRASLQARSNPETRVFQNDRADVAELCGADGVHVGQGDLPARELKATYPGLLCGLSTHSLEQLEQALLIPGLDYVALGPIYQTTSKRNPEPEVGLRTLEQAHALTLRAGVPLVAIGGIRQEQISEVAPHCEMIAAISLLLPPRHAPQPYQWIQKRAEELNVLIRECQFP